MIVIVNACETVCTTSSKNLGHSNPDRVDADRDSGASNGNGTAIGTGNAAYSMNIDVDFSNEIGNVNNAMHEPGSGDISVACLDTNYWFCPIHAQDATGA